VLKPTGERQAVYKEKIVRILALYFEKRNEKNSSISRLF
jgi:hypothetical protein